MFEIYFLFFTLDYNFLLINTINRLDKCKQITQRAATTILDRFMISGMVMSILCGMVMSILFEIYPKFKFLI